MKKVKRIGMVVALPEEQEHLIKSFGKFVDKYKFGEIKVTEFNYKDCKIFMADSGVGEIAAALSTQLLILKFNVDVILNFGVVGGLSGDLDCGGVAYVGEIVHYEFTSSYKNKKMAGKYLFQPDSFVFNADKNMLKLAKKVIGDRKVVRIVSGDKFVDDNEFRNWLINHFGGEICDMESAGIYFACKNHNIPFLMIKAVSDSADDNASADFNATIDAGVTFYADAVKKFIEYLSD